MWWDASDGGLVLTASEFGVLPNYVERGGEAVLRPPYRADDVDFYGFAIRASRPALDSMFHRYVNEPSGFKYDYRAASDIVLTVFTSTQKLVSTDRFDEGLGWTTEREVSYWVLGVDPESEELGFFVPYIFTDSPESVSGGREIFGFPKRLAAVGLPRSTENWLEAQGPPDSLPLDVKYGYLFDRPSHSTGPSASEEGLRPEIIGPSPDISRSPGRDVCLAYPTYEVMTAASAAGHRPWNEEPLVRVHTEPGTDSLMRKGSLVWTRGEAAIENVLSGILGVPAPIFVGERTGRFSRGRAVALRGFSFSREQETALGRLAEGIAENYDKTTVAFNLRGLIEDGGVRLLFLKQFRDAYQRGKAAYREVLPAVMQFSGDRFTRGFEIRAGSSAGDRQGVSEIGLVVSTAETSLFPIRRELGLQAEEDVLFAFFLRFGFQIELATGHRSRG